MSGKNSEARSTSTSPRRTRKKSAINQNNAVVSDISEAIKKMAGNSNNEGKSRPKVSSNKLSQKQKSTSKTAARAKEAIIKMINTDDTSKSSKEQEKNDQHDYNAEPTKESMTCDADQSNLSVLTDTDAVNCEALSEEQNELSLEAPIEATNGDILTSLKEVCELLKKLENDVHHPKDGIGAKMVSMHLRLDNLYSDIHGAVSGILPRLSQFEEKINHRTSRIEKMESNQDKILQLMVDMKKVTADVELMKNLFQKHSQKLQQLERSVLDLTRRGMEQNLVFHGISEHAEAGPENCKLVITNFVMGKLGVEVPEHDIWKAHRTGARRTDRARIIVTKLAYSAKEKIMANVTKLKDMKNEHDQKIFINEQIPEGIAETKKRISSRLKVLNKINDAKPVEQKQVIKAINDKIIIDGVVEEPDIKTPEPADLFMDPIELKIVRALGTKMKEAKPISNKNSQFVGLAVKVHSVEEMNRAYKAAALRFPAVDHIMAGYAFKDEVSVKMGVMRRWRIRRRKLDPQHLERVQSQKHCCLRGTKVRRHSPWF